MRHALAWILLALTVAWGVAILAAPRLLAAAGESRSPHAAPDYGADAARLVYMAGHILCHQRPERSFHVASMPYPLCARCTGLHLAAPFGLLALLLWRASRYSSLDTPTPMTSATAAGPRTRPLPSSSPPSSDALRPWRIALIVAAVPTIASVILEWIGGPTGMVSRCLAALPLGATVAALAGATLLGLDPPTMTARPRGSGKPAGEGPARAAD
jgi:hypothetical protein